MITKENITPEQTLTLNLIFKISDQVLDEIIKNLEMHSECYEPEVDSEGNQVPTEKCFLLYHSIESAVAEAMDFNYQFAL